MNDRNKIAADFAAALAADFEIHGAAAIATLRETKPEAYLRLAAAIEPDEYTPESNFADSLSDERYLLRSGDGQPPVAPRRSRVAADA